MTFMSKESIVETTSPKGKEDPTAESRKRDHIELAFQSQVAQAALDGRFFYEPLLSGHPGRDSLKSFLFFFFQKLNLSFDFSVIFHNIINLVSKYNFKLIN